MADSKQDCITLMAHYKKQERIGERQRNRIIKTREERIRTLQADLRRYRAQGRAAVIDIAKTDALFFEHALSFEIKADPGLPAVLEICGLKRKEAATNVKRVELVEPGVWQKIVYFFKSGDHAMLCKLKFNTTGAGVQP